MNELAGMQTDQQLPSAQREQLHQSFETLHDALDNLKGADNETTASQLADLEHQLWTLFWQIQRLENGNGFLQHEHLLQEVRDWTQFTQNLNLTETGRQGNALAQEITVRLLQGWKKWAEESGGSATAEECFQVLFQLTALELSICNHEGYADEVQHSLFRARQLCQEKFLHALKHQAPPEQQRHDWVLALCDQGSMVLTDLPDLQPNQAASELMVVEKDLAWYLENVENNPGPRQRSLQRKCKRLLAEADERTLQSRLEVRFGSRLVTFFESLVFWLTFVVLGLLLIEGVIEYQGLAQSYRETLHWILWADTAICGVFLLEFFVKLAHAPRRVNWFRRHFLIDLLPSIPFGLLGLHAADPARGGRLLRLLRLSRFARYLRVIRNIVRILRVLGFLTRGMDRFARRYASLLNRSVILYPNSRERHAFEVGEQSLLVPAQRLQARIRECWQELLEESSQESGRELAQRRLQLFHQAAQDSQDGWSAHLVQRSGSQQRDMPVDVLILRLIEITPEEITAHLGGDSVDRLAQMVRLLARPPFRWLPPLSGWVASIHKASTDADLVAQVAHNIAKDLARWQHTRFWALDLYGTITPTQFVDRCGSVLVRSTIRPAYRLTTFGVLFLLAKLLLGLTGLPILVPVSNLLWGYLGMPIIIMGVVCTWVVGLGYWLRHLAREATDFHEESAMAQFLHLTEIIRARNMERDARILYQRVILPERELRKGAQALRSSADLDLFLEMTRCWLMGNHCPSEARSCFDPVARTVLLYRDTLDGALLTDSDTRTTHQLLGNLVLRRFRTWSRRFDEQAEHELQRLTLGRQRFLLGGPYLWFLLLNRAISHLTAQLLIEYNRNALPIVEQEQATEEELGSFRNWLQAGTFDPRVSDLGTPRDVYAGVVTTAFTALHFLDDDPQRDREVEERFGPEVLQRLHNDRKVLIRQVFGSYPSHEWPREQRVLNLHVLYEGWLAHGRVLLFPLLLLRRMARFIWQVLRWMWKCIDEIRHPEKRADLRDAAKADFFTAIRKIDRMRGPIVRASLRLRAIVDPEYLGVSLPGSPDLTPLDCDYKNDCRFLNVEPDLVEELQEQAKRAKADMERVGQLIQAGLLKELARHLGISEDEIHSPVYIRALAVVYLADYFEVRELLSCEEIIKEVYDKTASEAPLPMRPWPFFMLLWRFRRYCRQKGIQDGDRRLTAWRATVHNVDGVAEALNVWAKHGENARSKGIHILAQLLRHPGRIDETLVTLRAVQTLAILDVLQHREHIFRLGAYAEDGVPVERYLRWGNYETDVSSQGQATHV